MAKTVYDKNSTFFLSGLVALNSVIIFTSPILNSYNLGYINAPVLIWIGTIVMIIGLTLRLSAAHTLGRSYTTTLREDDNHKLITKGLYKRIRHPGYLGTILLFFGGGLTVLSWLSLLVTVLLIFAYVYRMKAEEDMLVDVFGQDYKKYMKRSFKLIPYIY
jgi:protein-S-isoprenylcysteine O-methyltransferase Ste14